MTSLISSFKSIKYSQQWQQQHPPPNAAAGKGAGGWNQNSCDASQEELPAPEMRKAEVVKVKKEKDHAAAISDVFAKSFQARARARRACALRVLGLLLADGTPTVGEGKTF